MSPTIYSSTAKINLKHHLSQLKMNVNYEEAKIWAINKKISKQTNVIKLLKRQ